MSIDFKDIAGAGEVGKEIIKQTCELIKEPVANLTNPVTRTAGQRLSDFVDLIFTPMELAKIHKEYTIEKFKLSLEKKKEAIPNEKRVMPPINVVGPALEAAKYHIEDEILREMFATLIASSMNSDTSHLTHPSFVEIIKQLSPLDAVNISYCGRGVLFPVVDYVINTNVKIPIVPNVILLPEGNRNIYEISPSITNLIRLGLVEVDYSIFAGDGSEFKSTDLIAQAALSVSGASSEEQTKIIDIKKGMLRPTIYGRNFVNTCVEQNLTETSHET